MANKKNNISADVKNNNNQNLSHNNATYKAAADNRSNQLNPNNSNYQGEKK